MPAEPTTERDYLKAKLNEILDWLVRHGHRASIRPGGGPVSGACPHCQTATELRRLEISL